MAKSLSISDFLNTPAIKGISSKVSGESLATEAFSKTARVSPTAIMLTSHLSALEKEGMSQSLLANLLPPTTDQDLLRGPVFTSTLASIAKEHPDLKCVQETLNYYDTLLELKNVIITG